MLGRTGELVSESPTASEDAVKNNEQQDGQKSALTSALTDTTDTGTATDDIASPAADF